MRDIRHLIRYSRPELCSRRHRLQPARLSGRIDRSRSADAAHRVSGASREGLPASHRALDRECRRMVKVRRSGTAGGPFRLGRDRPNADNSCEDIDFRRAGPKRRRTKLSLPPCGQRCCLRFPILASLRTATKVFPVVDAVAYVPEAHSFPVSSASFRRAHNPSAVSHSPANCNAIGLVTDPVPECGTCGSPLACRRL